MTTRPDDAITRLAARYYNEDAVSAENPGGLDESDDGLTAGHVTNFPDALEDFGTVAVYVGEAVADAERHAQNASDAKDVVLLSVDTTTTARDLTLTYRDAAKGYRDQAQTAAAGVNLPAISAVNAGQGLEVKADGSGWQLVSILKAAGGTLTGWLQTYGGVDAANLGLRIGEATSGFYRSGAGVVGYVAAGVEVFRTAATGVLTFKKAVRSDIVALNDAATITPDCNSGNVFAVTLSGNRTIANPSNLSAGQEITLLLKQDVTGSRTASWGSYWKFPGGSAPTLTTSAGKTDRIVGHAVSTTEIHVVAVKGF